MPSSSARASRPSGVTRTARPDPIRATQPRVRNRSHSRAPATPARCGRRSVQSRQPRATGRFPPSSARPCPASPRQPGLRQRETAGLVQQAARRQRVRHRHPEPPGEMVVAGPAPREGRGRRRRPQPHGAWDLRRQPRRHVLQQRRDRGVGEPDIPVPPLPLLGQQPAGRQPVQVLGRRGARNPGMPGQLPGGPRPPVEQRQAYRGPRLIGEQRGELASEDGAVTVPLSAPSVRRVPNDPGHTLARCRRSTTPATLSPCSTTPVSWSRRCPPPRTASPGCGPPWAGSARAGRTPAAAPSANPCCPQ